MAVPEPTPYVVAGSRPWNRTAFEHWVLDRPDSERWAFAASRDELDALLESLDPRAVFFLHWSWIVPTATTTRWECVCFHMTDVPYGRGGSPLQNLIVRGHTETVLSALRMTDEVDAGPVYAKRPLSLAGTAEEVYARATELSLAMAADLVADPVDPVDPVPQVGEPVRFDRRTPDQSELPGGLSLDGVVDHVRMLDADGYPRAFVRHDGLRLELRGAVRYADRVEARVVITLDDRSDG